MSGLTNLKVTAEDVKSIKGDWLTDNVISFWEEFLEKEKLSAYPKASICLLRPSMCTMLLNTKQPLELKSALPDFSKTTHIFLPVNDNRQVSTPEGGSHWSLLLVSVVDRSAFHYDSLDGANDQEAQEVASALAKILDLRIRFVPMRDCPTQENGSDCGVFVCLFMQHLLLRRLLLANSNEKISMSMSGREINATKGRKVMLEKIEDERKKQRKERS